MKKYNKEFVKGKQSFFQRAAQGDEPMARHFVAVVASVVDVVTGAGGGHLLVQISDGAYVLEARVENMQNAASHIKSCQSELYRLIKTGKIFEG